MTPEDVAYLRAKAQANGYNADDLLKVINYESSGRPGVWGGKGSNYFGLIQFGPNERKQFGVDTANPSAPNQIDATMRYLAARGFKPGMGLMDLYSTVNAGSPGHYNRSDGNGTVSSHVAKMMGGSAPAMMPSTAPPSVPGMALAFAPEEGEAPAGPLAIEDLLQQPDAERLPEKRLGGLIGLRQAMNEQDDEPAYDEQMKRQMTELHNRIHEAALQGLLGRN